MKTSVERVQSTDGTSIALEMTGNGSAVVLIGGAFNDRTTTAGLACVLAPYYRVVTYDRRGRGESGDESVDYSVDREMEDLRALIDHLGGTASLVGHSSGAVLALEAAVRRLPVDKVAAYEPPFIPEGSRSRPARDVAGPTSPTRCPTTSRCSSLAFLCRTAGWLASRCRPWSSPGPAPSRG